jgi:hypothetical protein
MKISSKKPTVEEVYKKMILNSCYGSTGIEPIINYKIHYKRIISPGIVLIRKFKIKKILSKI